MFRTVAHRPEILRTLIAHFRAQLKRDGILSAEVILSYERVTKSVKMAEINLRVHGAVLTARGKSEDFIKSIDATVEKLEVQLAKYKTKKRSKAKGKTPEINEET